LDPNMLYYIVAIIAIMYFLVLRPQRKKEKERRAMLDNVKKGDRIVTIGGIHGEVVNTREKSVFILVDKEHDVTLKMSRGAINQILTGDETADDDDKQAL
jgi:preprotein translocase subunit YajC